MNDFKEEIEHVLCPACKAQSWVYTPKAEHNDYELYKCSRCGFGFKLGKCKKCNTNNWISLRKNFEKHARKSIERYQCDTCKRIISIQLEG